MSGAEPLVPMADLAGRWGITSNTVSRRLSFLGIKPIRQGNFRFITPEQLELASEVNVIAAVSVRKWGFSGLCGGGGRLSFAAGGLPSAADAR